MRRALFGLRGDGVPKIAATLSPADFEAYARPYLDHRRRLAAARTARS